MYVLWNVTSGTRLPYFESQFRVSPFRSPLTWRGSASPRCAWTPLPDIAEFPAAEGTLTHGKPLGSTQLYFSQLLELLCHILSLFFFPLFSSFRLTDGVWIFRKGRRQRTSGLPSDGAPGLRELRAHGGRRVNANSGWTLLPGKNRKVLFYNATMLVYIYFSNKGSHLGIAPGECLWHKRNAQIQWCRSLSMACFTKIKEKTKIFPLEVTISMCYLTC